MSTAPKRDTIFLFGAGASVDAGIPDTYSFYKEFEKFIGYDFPELIEALIEIKTICETFNNRENNEKKRSKLDIEQLLGILRQLSKQENDLLLEFYDNKKFNPRLSKNAALRLVTILEDFIRARVIAKEENLRYLEELLNFETPLEIYSTNYDTCIEQLSYRHHRRYTDGFDINWNEDNFEKDFDIKHYKMHGSIIWYTNTKTKECMKLPVLAFSNEGKPVHLKLIYGEEVKPLIMYPADKADYREPLTELQQKFKRRLLDRDTKAIVIVGYSFRDNYIANMIWDAAKSNESLNVILIAPNANEIFEEKLKYVEAETASRIADRVICLCYPFASVVPELKNHYLRTLTELRIKEVENKLSEKNNGWADWRTPLQLAIECEFLTKAEEMIKKLGGDWDDIAGSYQRQNWLVYAFKGLLSSVINNCNTTRWIKRINLQLRRLSAEDFYFNQESNPSFRPVFHIYQNKDKSGGYTEMDLRDILEYWINPCFTELYSKNKLLTPAFANKLNKLNNNLLKLEALKNYFDSLCTVHTWNDYLLMRQDFADIIKPKLDDAVKTQEWRDLKLLAAGIERKIFADRFGTCIQFDSAWHL